MTKDILQGIRGDMREIHVTRQFLEAGGPQGHFFDKTKNLFWIRSLGVCVPNFRSVSFFVWPGGVAQLHK